MGEKVVISLFNLFLATGSVYGMDTLKHVGFAVWADRLSACSLVNS